MRGKIRNKTNVILALVAVMVMGLQEVRVQK